MFRFLLIALLPLAIATSRQRAGNYRRFHNSGCINRSVMIQTVKSGVPQAVDQMTCDKIRIRCSEITARNFLHQILRFDDYQAHCSSVTAADKDCVYPSGCVRGVEKLFNNTHTDQVQKLCVGTSSVIERPVLVPVRYAPLPPNLPDFERYVFFDNLKPRDIKVETGDGYHAFDPVIVCQSDDVYARVIPKFVFNQLTNDSHNRADFITIDSSTEFTTVMLNINPEAKKYYDTDFFPLPFVINNWSYNVFCNSSAVAISTQPCAFPQGCIINALNDYKCDTPTVFPPFRFCLDQYYSLDRACIHALTPVSLQAVPNINNYIVWVFPH